MEFPNRIRSLMALLDDPDEQIFLQVREALMSEPSDLLLAVLQQEQEQNPDPTAAQRILQMLGELEEQSLISELKQWKLSGTHDVLDAWFMISRQWKPDLSRQEMENLIDRIKLDAWLELREDLTSFEKIRILNHIFFKVHGFKGDTENYHQSANSLLHKVLERKTGNPISLAVIYSLVAQRLNIPVYGVNLPQHFILGYHIDDEEAPIRRLNDAASINPEAAGEDVLFYINPFNNGIIFSRNNVQAFLEQMNIKPEDRHFRLCSNMEIIQRMLRNLINSCATEGREQKAKLYQAALEMLQS